MMTEFDEMMAIRRIADLLREQGENWSEHRIRAHVTKIARRTDTELDEAYEIMECSLLDHNPRPEKW